MNLGPTYLKINLHLKKKNQNFYMFNTTLKTDKFSKPQAHDFNRKLKMFMKFGTTLI